MLRIIKNIILILLFFFFKSNLYGQVFDYTIHGQVFDSATLAPIPNVNLIIEGTKYGTVTNENGLYNLKYRSNKKLSKIHIQVSHVSYNNHELILTPKEQEQTNIFISQKILELPEIKIFGVPQIIYSNNEFNLFDYEISNDTIFLIVYEKKLERSKLLIIDNNFEPICIKDIGKPVGIFEDCSGNVNLITFLYPYKIKFSDKCFDMVFTQQDISNKLYMPCVATTNNGYVFSYFYGTTRYTAEYSFFVPETGEDSTFRHIEDTLHSKTIINKADKKNQGKNKRSKMADTKLSEWTGKANIYFDPVTEDLKNDYLYCPMFYLADSIFLFNHIENVIEVYNKRGTLAKTIAISYHKEKGWLKKIIIDKITNKAYTLFQKNKKYMLAEIDLIYGNAKEPVSIKFPWIDKIQVLNGVLYFLYKTDAVNYKKSLYKQTL